MTAGGQDLSGFSMLELFRQEAETQTALLSEGLLAIEHAPGKTDPLAGLMRAAHSLKGAARIVGLDAAVRIAHALEDCFVAAQKNEITIRPDSTDVLLRSVDLLAQLARLPEQEMMAPPAARQVEIDSAIRQLNDLRAGAQAPAPAQKPAPVAPDAPPSAPPEAAVAPEGSDRVVRVSSANLTRMLGMMGEVLVQVRWFEPFMTELQQLKQQQAELARMIEQETVDAGGAQNDRPVRQQLEACRQQLAQCMEDIDFYARQSSDLAERLYREGLASRMRPFSDGARGFPRMVRDLARQLNKQVKFEITGLKTGVDREIIEKLEAPLAHLLRNALDHGLETPDERVAAGKPAEGRLTLEARHQSGQLLITVTDDGRGINLESLRKKIVAKGLNTEDVVRRLADAEILEFLFLPGFSTSEAVTEISGRGVGLDVVQTLAQDVGGVVRMENRPGAGASFHLQLPITLSVMRALLVEIAGEPYALPLTRMDHLATARPEDIHILEGRRYLSENGRNIGLVDAREVLELTGAANRPAEWPVVVIGARAQTYGLVVDRFLGESKLVVRTLDARLGKVRDVSAASLLDDGTPVMILDTEDMIRSIENLLSGGHLKNIQSGGATVAAKKQKNVLVADDSITVREMERKMLENRGYSVEVAVDGMDAWNHLRLGHYDLVVSDVDMPRMNGIDLVRQIKADSRLKSLPVVIVSYKDREEDRLRGLEAGANYYLTKSSFHDESFLKAIHDLIGAP